MEMNKKRKLLCSGGFGTMGYSIPAAIGASFGDKKSKIISTCGDGSFQMSLFELATIKQEGLIPLIILFNNNGLGMVKEIQKIKNKNKYGVDMNCNPDFTVIAQAYGWKSKTIKDKNNINESLKEAIESNEPYLLEFIVDDNESTL